jgi:uncharacterized protein (TIGR03382 family)
MLAGYFVSNDGSVIDNDIGLVRLPSPLPHTPIPLNADPLTTDNVGEVLRWVGWEASGDDDTGGGTDTADEPADTDRPARDPVADDAPKGCGCASPGGAVSPVFAAFGAFVLLARRRRLG